MKGFRPKLDALRTVVAAVLEPSGILLSANAGCLRLLPPALVQPIGADVARLFVQPGFAWLVGQARAAGGYRGLLTLGEPNGLTRTLRGHVWEVKGTLRVLAEYDIDELERLSGVILELNQEASVLQYALASANATLRSREERILGESLTDVLTGLGNRRKLEQALAAEISRVRREGGSLSAIMLDIDHFKRVNDVHGHAAGDRVLAALGALLRSQTRPTDILVRFGGEELFLLLPHTDLGQALVKAEQLRRAVEALVIAPLDAPVTASFGVAELVPGEDAPSLLRRVDAALYLAKARGRNRVVAADSAGVYGVR